MITLNDLKICDNCGNVFSKKIGSFSLIPKEKEELSTDTGKNQGRLK